MERCVLLILITVPGKVIIHSLAGIFADSIEPKDKDNIISKEGESVTLSCTYDTSSNNILLYWYRQYPNKDPQYLLYKGSITSQTSTELTIKSVTLSDSALYYCALSVGAQ
uniref:T-cell receptor alpha/delta variable 26.0 n=2 Tax=Cyprinus carpio TaxID=7962 RepID=A0A8C1B4K9_CYPCA